MKKVLIILLGYFLTIPLLAQENSILDKKLVKVLDTIYNSDQNLVLNGQRVQNEFGYDSNEAMNASKKFHENHIINLAKIESILQKRGWLGADIVGEQGNYTLFLIIQHSELEIQLKYLPMMRKAAKAGNVVPRDLAHLEDRIASKTEKLQIYGTTIKRYSESGIFDVWPIIDPENVDKRRLSVGLEPIAEFLKNNFGLEWNLKNQIERTKEFIIKKSL